VSTIGFETASGNPNEMLWLQAWEVAGVDPASEKVNRKQLTNGPDLLGR
jgi:hypothetical protein